MLGHSDLILKNLVKEQIELPYTTTMLKQTNLAARFCKIRSKVKISMCSLSGPRVFQPLLVDPTQVESKKSSQIQWPVPSINVEPVDIFLGEE